MTENQDLIMPVQPMYGGYGNGGMGGFGYGGDYSLVADGGMVLAVALVVVSLVMTSHGS